MSTLSMQRWARRHKLAREGDMAHGEVEGYLLTLSFGTRHILAAVAAPLSAKFRSELSAFLSDPDTQAAYGLLAFSHSPACVRLLFSSKRNCAPGAQALLSRLLSLLREHGCVDSSHCAYCRQPLPDSPISRPEIDGAWYPAHQHCQWELRMQEEKARGLRLNEPHYVWDFLFHMLEIPLLFWLNAALYIWLFSQREVPLSSTFWIFPLSFISNLRWLFGKGVRAKSYLILYAGTLVGTLLTYVSVAVAIAARQSGQILGFLRALPALLFGKTLGSALLIVLLWWAVVFGIASAVIALVRFWQRLQP